MGLAYLCKYNNTRIIESIESTAVVAMFLAQSHELIFQPTVRRLPMTLKNKNTSYFDETLIGLLLELLFKVSLLAANCDLSTRILRVLTNSRKYSIGKSMKYELRGV